MDIVNESAEKINACLNCKKPKCNNCLAYPKKAKVKKEKQKLPYVSLRGREEEFFELYNAGHSDTELAQLLGVPRENVTSYRSRRGLARNDNVNYRRRRSVCN